MMMATNLLIISLTLFFEAEGEIYLGKMGVATVIWNRHIERKMSLVEVCKQHFQFSCWNKRKGLPMELPSGREWNSCLRITKRMLSGEFLPISDVNHFYNPSKCNPGWAKHLRNKTKIGNHIFGWCK